MFFLALGGVGMIAAARRLGAPSLHEIMLDCYLPTPNDHVANMQATGAGSLSCSGPSEVFVGVSTDSGATFNDYRVAFIRNGRVPNWAVKPCAS